MSTRAEHIRRLRNAYADKNLTLYLGAGVSVGSGLPTWEQLVLSMFFSAMSQQSMGGWRPFPNYLFAIAEWHLRRGAEPLEITARKIRKYYPQQDDFLREVRQTLYAGFAGYNPDDFEVHPDAIRIGNSTLAAVAGLCEGGADGSAPVCAVITYNYDSLLETVLPDGSCQPIWKSSSLQSGCLPVYHVHGYIPFTGKGSTGEDLVFTEDQYHLAAQDPYSWANLVQIQSMSSSTGLMVGLSLSDRNMRRLLDATKRAPLHTENYALLQKPHWPPPGADDLQEMHQRAQSYLARFERAGVKGVGVKGPSWQDQIRGILAKVEQLAEEQQYYVLEQLGIQPIWYETHDEVPGIIDEISTV